MVSVWAIKGPGTSYRSKNTSFEEFLDLKFSNHGYKHATQISSDTCSDRSQQLGLATIVFIIA
jgi:hypothetical protein